MLALNSRRCCLAFSFTLIQCGMAMMPPSEWMEEAQSSNCANLVPALIHIYNDSRSRFDVFWVNPNTQKLKQISADPVEDRQVVNYNSHVGQILELHEIPNETTGECASQDQVCRRSMVKLISDVKLENVWRLNSNFEVIALDDLRARAYLGEVIPSDVTFINRTGGSQFDVFWVDVKKDERLKLTVSPVEVGKRASYNSHVVNVFEVEEVGQCADTNTCRKARYQNAGNSPVVHINENFECLVKGVLVSDGY